MDDSAVLSSKTASEVEVILPARLIVNGKDITEGNHVYIDVQVCQAEVPLLAILKELGVEIKWQGDSVVEILYNGESNWIDIRDENFGFEIPPGGGRKVRKIIENDLVLYDGSIRPMLRAMMNAYISIDYENSIVNVKTQ